MADAEHPVPGAAGAVPGTKRSQAKAARRAELIAAAARQMASRGFSGVRLEDIGAEEPVVVFCRFHGDLDAVHDACKTVGYASLELSGRRDELARWQSGEAQVLAVQISSGGVGVDLTRARYSIYYSLSFSLGEYDQALSRVHRPGQTRSVEHIHLVARQTVDEKILRALEKRAEVIQAILAEIKG